MKTLPFPRIGLPHSNIKIYLFTGCGPKNGFKDDEQEAAERSFVTYIKNS
jgi:hypothetical protein